MKRRSFLAMLGVAPVAAIMPGCEKAASASGGPVVAMMTAATPDNAVSTITVKADTLAVRETLASYQEWIAEATGPQSALASKVAAL